MIMILLNYDQEVGNSFEAFDEDDDEDDDDEEDEDEDEDEDENDVAK